jgi:hypothetical protein
MGKMGKVKRLKDGLAETFERTPPGQFMAGGKRVVCSNCGGPSFVKRRIFIYGPLAHCLTCTECSLSMWFEDAPERVRA